MNGNINNNQQKQWYLHQFIVGVADKEKMSQYFKKNLEPNGKYTYLQTIFEGKPVCQYFVHTKLPTINIKGVNFYYSQTRESHETSKTFNDMVKKNGGFSYTQPNVNNAINNNMNMQNRVHQNQMQVNKNKINIGNNKIVFGGNAKNVVQKKQEIANPIKNKQDSKHEKDNVGPDFLYFGSDNKVYTGRLVSSKMAMMKLANEIFIKEYKKRCTSAGKQQKYFVLNPKVQKQVDELLLGQYTRTPSSSGSCHIINSEYYEQRYKELYKQLREIDYEPNQQRIVNQMVFYELRNNFGKGLQRK